MNIASEKQTIIGAIILAMFSILAQYSLPIMSYGLIIIVVYGMMTCFMKRGSFLFNKSILWFIFWCLISQLYIYLKTGTFEKNANTYFFMCVALFIISTLYHINLNSFFNVYYILGLFFSGVVIYQFIMGNIIGIPQSAIRILPVSSEDMHFWIQNSSRVSGFFVEPQAFSSYILPLLILVLFRRKYKSAIFISIAIFASTSSQGIIIGLFVWGYYLIAYEKDGRKKFFRLIGGILSVIILLVVVRNISVLKPIIDKIFSIQLGSYDIRLTKGFLIYGAMPFGDKLTGIGFGNLQEYLLNGNFSFYWMRLTRPELLGYITSMSNILVSFGIVAFGFYINIFVKNWKTSSPEAKLMLIVILISSFTQTILFNVWFIFYWILYMIFDEHDNNRYIYASFEGRRINV